eukprot:scaffold3509_cov105-Phaeocystis_antarctica.AAC.1
MALETKHTPAADAQVGYSPGAKSQPSAARPSISIEKEGASMSTQAGTAPKARAGARRSEDARTKVNRVV